MGLGFGRESEMKTCPARRVVGSPQAATMRFNDRAADPQPHTGALNLRSEECIKDLVCLLRRQSHAGIADRQHDLLVFRSLRFDCEIPCPLHFLHCINAVDDEVHQHLLQLHAISHDLGNIGGQIRPDKYRVARCLVAHQDDHLSDHFIYIHQLPLRSTLLEEQTDPVDDFRRPRCVFHDSQRSLARLFQIGLIAREPAQTGIGVSDGGGNRLFHFMRQRSSQFSQGGHPADVCEIRLRLAQSPFSAITGFLKPPFYLHQAGDQQRRSQEGCKSQKGSRLAGLGELRPQKKVVEGQRGESNREQTRPQTSEEATYRHREKETRRRGIYGPSHRQRDPAANCRQAVAPNCGENSHPRLSGGSSSLAAILTNSASDSACIFCITCPRWIFTVISLVPRSKAICLLSLPKTTRSMTSRSRGVSDSWRFCNPARS